MLLRAVYEPAKNKAILKFLDYALHDGAADATGLDYVPLPPKVVKQIEVSLAPDPESDPRSTMSLNLLRVGLKTLCLEGRPSRPGHLRPPNRRQYPRTKIPPLGSPHLGGGAPCRRPFLFVFLVTFPALKRVSHRLSGGNAVLGFAQWKSGATGRSRPPVPC